MENLVLIGVGLIGGSLALDLKQTNQISTVTGIDIDQSNLDCALARGIIDQGYCHIDEASIAQADVIIIATPVTTLPQICRQIAEYIRPDTIISDVGSTKRLALAAFATELPKHYAYCVAAHPIAGSDRYGAQAAQTGLFAQKKCIICPHEGQNKQALAKIESMWASVGAKVSALSASQHDYLLAAVSHLPHMLAYAYMHQLAEYPDINDLLNFAGSGFNDFSRIAGSQSQVWTDICLANRDTLLSMLQQQQQTLQILQQYLEQENRAGLQTFFETAQAARENWSNC